MLRPIFLSVFLGSIALPAFAEAPAVALKQVYPQIKMTKPLALSITPDGRQLLVEQTGRILLLPKDQSATEATVVLDLSDRKLAEGKGSDFEEGIVGFALHPEFAANQKAYVTYTQQDPKRLVLAEFQFSKSTPDRLDPATERVLLTIPLPHWNHHSGNLAFGPDGFLYLPLGDGGGPKGGDPNGFAQNMFSLLGKILRIDVNTKTGAREYGIPKDNPFVGKAGHYPEVYATGMRNPWGMAFAGDGTLWFADVGQSIAEEINVLEKGGNYGWNFREGIVAWPGQTQAPAGEIKFIEPIHTYGRDQGISITGGVHYKGKALPALTGKFIYGDWGTGRLWALQYDPATKKSTNEALFEPTAEDKKIVKPTGFAHTSEGEIYVLDWSGGLYVLAPKG